MLSRRTKLYVVYGLAAAVSLVAFTPLVIPSGIVEPRLLGMPRTLWSGILITVVLVFLTYLAARYSPSDVEAPEDCSEMNNRSSRPA